MYVLSIFYVQQYIGIFPVLNVNFRFTVNSNSATLVRCIVA